MFVVVLLFNFSLMGDQFTCFLFIFFLPLYGRNVKPITTISAIELFLVPSSALSTFIAYHFHYTLRDLIDRIKKKNTHINVYNKICFICLHRMTAIVRRTNAGGGGGGSGGSGGAKTKETEP